MYASNNNNNNNTLQAVVQGIKVVWWKTHYIGLWSRTPHAHTGTSWGSSLHGRLPEFRYHKFSERDGYITITNTTITTFIIPGCFGT